MVKKVNSDTKGLSKILESMKTYCVLLCDEQKIPNCSICRFQLAMEQVATHRRLIKKNYGCRRSVYRE